MMPFTPGHKTRRRKLSEGQKSPPSQTHVAAPKPGLKAAPLPFVPLAFQVAKKPSLNVDLQGRFGSLSPGARWM